MKHLGALILLVFGSQFVFAQYIENVNAVVNQDEVVVHYDLRGFDNEKYDVKLYYSLDERKIWEGPCIMVSGDVGKNQNFGLNKQIVWQQKIENITKDGAIQFKVEATVFSEVKEVRKIAEESSPYIPQKSTSKYQTTKYKVKADPWTFDSNYKKYRTRKYIWMGVTACGAAGFTACQITGKVEEDETIGTISGGCFLVTLSGSLMTWGLSSKLKGIKEKYAFHAVPYKDGAQFSLTYNF